MKTLWFMHALGRDGLPASVEFDGVVYKLDKTVKHDFWAGTGFYKSDLGQKCVVKINRNRLGSRLIGRWLCKREMRAYEKLADVPNIPALFGPVGWTGFAHDFVEGQPLSKGLAIPDRFFDELVELINELNRRGIAYVDTNKPQNILLGDDGRPHLIDFQISFDANAWYPRALGRWWLKFAYDSDVYHVLKNKRRFRPDLLTDGERHRVEHRAWYLQIHRTISKPYHWVRKPLMRWLKRSGRVMDAGSD